MDKKKILSSLALAGILTASALGANVNATTEGEYLKPVGVYKKLIDGEMVVPFILKEKRTPLTVKDIQSEFKNLSLVNGNAVTDTNAVIRTGDTFVANEIEHRVVIYGDVNKDGIITTADASLIQRVRANKENPLEPAQFIAANVLSSDQRITTADASRVQRYVANKEDCAIIVDPIPEKEDVTAPVISGVTEEERKVINLNDTTFKLPEATAIDDYDGKVEVTTEGEVDVTTVGEYPIIYKAVDREGHEATVTYTVVVDNQAPEISGLPEGNEIYVKQGEELTLPTVKANDVVDGELLVNLVITNSDEEEIEEIDTTVEGEYTLTYTTEDSLGNKQTATVAVKVDGTNPIIESVVYTPEASIQTNQDVTVTITVNESIEKPAGWNYGSADKKVITKTYAENVTAEEVKIKDLAGNEIATTITILNIDKEKPKVENVEDQKTYKEVTPTFNADEVSVSTLQKDEEAPKAYVSGTKIGNTDMTQDGNYILIVRDVAGNETTVRFTIDNEKPVLTNTSEKTLLKYGDNVVDYITVTASDNSGEEIIPELTITNADGDTVDSINDIDTTKDGVYTFTYNAKDSAENEADSLAITVTVDATPAKMVSLIPSTNKVTTEVTMTVEFNEPMQEQSVESGWIATSDRTFTKKYTSNTIGEEVVEFKDIAGNVTSVNYTIENIDETELIGVVTYNPNTGKAQEVEVTIRSNNGQILKEVAGWDLAEDKKSMTKTYHANVEDEKITIEDEAGHRNVVTISINNIDTTKPTAIVEYSSSTPISGDVTVTVTVDEEVEGLEGWTKTVTEDKKTILTKPYTANGTETIHVTDMAGNVSEDITISVNNIDKDAPTITGYTEGINSYQNLTLTFTDLNGVVATLQKDNGETTPIEPATGVELTEEGIYIITLKDNLGNEKSYSFVIDQTPVEVKGPENGGKYNKITPIFTEGVGRLEKLDGTTYVKIWKSGDEINEAGQYKLTVTDEAENENVITFEIDKTLPQFTNINNDQIFNNTQVPFTPTTDKTTRTVVLTKDDKVVESYTQLAPISEDGNYKLEVTDEAGNKADVNFTIDTKVEYREPTTSNDGEPTNKNVVVTIKADEDLEEVPGWDLSTDKRTLTKTYSVNGSDTVTITDKAGNTQVVSFEVAGIDKVALQAVVSYSNDDLDNPGQTKPAKAVTVKIEATAGKQLKEKAGWVLSDDKTYMTKEYKADTTVPEDIEVEDIAGNTKTVQVNVTNVYDKNPEITITGELNTAVTEVSVEKGKIVLPTVTAIDAKGEEIAQITRVIEKIEGNTTVVINNDVTEINLTSACKYEITYTAIDVAGNSTTVTRTVIVK